MKFTFKNKYAKSKAQVSEPVKAPPPEPAKAPSPVPPPLRRRRRGISKRVCDAQQQIWDADKAVENRDALLTDKLAPKRLSDVIGNPRARSSVASWAKAAASRTGPIRALALTGPAGVGKSVSARLGLQAAGFTTIHEINASSIKTVWALVLEMHRIGARSALPNTALIVEELDGIMNEETTTGKKPASWSGWGDGENAGSTAVATLVYLAKTTPLSMIPVVFTANELDKESVRKVIDGCVSVRFWPVDSSEMVSYVRKRIRTTLDLRKLADAAQGDVRSFINKVDFYRRTDSEVSSRIEFKTNSIFECLDRILFNPSMPRVADIDDLDRIYNSDGRIKYMIPMNSLRYMFDMERSIDTLTLMSDAASMPSSVQSVVCSWGLWQTRAGRPRSVPTVRIAGKYRFTRPGCTAKRSQVQAKLPKTRTCADPTETELALKAYYAEVPDPDDRRVPSGYGVRVERLHGLTKAQAKKPLEAVFEVSRSDLKKELKSMGIKV